MSSYNYYPSYTAYPPNSGRYSPYSGNMYPSYPPPPRTHSSASSNSATDRSTSPYLPLGPRSSSTSPPPHHLYPGSALGYQRARQLRTVSAGGRLYADDDKGKEKLVTEDSTATLVEDDQENQERDEMTGKYHDQNQMEMERKKKQDDYEHRRFSREEYIPSRCATPTPKDFINIPPPKPTSEPLLLFFFSTTTFAFLHLFPLLSSWTRTLRLHLGFYPSLFITLTTSLAGGQILRSRRETLSQALTTLRAHPASREMGAFLGSICLAYITALLTPLSFRILHTVCSRIPILGAVGVFFMLCWTGMLLGIVGLCAIAFFSWDVTKVVHGAVVRVFQYCFSGEDETSSSSGSGSFRVVNAVEGELEVDDGDGEEVSCGISATEEVEIGEQGVVAKGKMVVGCKVEKSGGDSGVSTPALSRSSSFADRRMVAF